MAFFLVQIMPTIIERTQSALRAFKHTTAPIKTTGEISVSDSESKLFPKGFFTRYNPSELVTKKGLEIYDRMRMDDQVKSSLAFKKHSMLSTGWEIKSPGNEDPEWEPTEFIRWSFDNMDQGDTMLEASFRGSLLEILTALDYGFSVSEKVLIESIPYGPFVGKVGLSGIKTRRPHDFAFDTDEFGNLLPDGIIQYQGDQDARLQRDKFLIYVYGHEFSNWYGQSDLEAAYRPWWTKDNAYKWMAMSLERYGIPPLFFLYNNFGPQEVEALKLIAQNIQAGTSGVIPRADKDSLEIWSPELVKNIKDAFVPSLAMFNTDIARALLVPTLLGSAPEGDSGSFARSKKSFEMFMMIIEHVRGEIETVINRQLIKGLVDFNYVVDEYPTFQFLPFTDELRISLFDKWFSAVEKGIIEVQEDDEDHARATLGLPERDETKVKEKEDEEPEPKDEGMTLKNHKHKVSDSKKIEKGLDAIESQAHTEITDVLKETRDSLLSFVSKTTIDVGLTKELRLKKGNDLQVVVREFLRRSFSFGQSTMESLLAKYFVHQEPMFTPKAALKWLDANAVFMSGILRDRLLSDSKAILLNAIKTGEDQSETVGKLKDVFEPYVGNPSVLRDGAEISAFRMNTFIRTNGTSAFNQGRLVTARDPRLAPFMTGMEYSAILDSRTTEICAFLDGRVFKMSDPELSRLSPANHHNCRSVLVPVTIDISVPEGDFLEPKDTGKAISLASKGFV